MENVLIKEKNARKEKKNCRKVSGYLFLLFAKFGEASSSTWDIF